MVILAKSGSDIRWLYGMMQGGNLGRRACHDTFNPTVGILFTCVHCRFKGSPEVLSIVNITPATLAGRRYGKKPLEGVCLRQGSVGRAASHVLSAEMSS